MPNGFSISGPPEVMELLVTNHTPWPMHEGNPTLLRQQGLVERIFFEDDTTINFDQIPALQSWAPLVGHNEFSRVNHVVASLMQASKLAKRPLTAEEVRLTSDFAASAFRWHPWVSLASISTALGFTWFGRHKFRFPFYTPRPGSAFNPTVFPTKSLPLMRGPVASLAWHSLRFGLYYAICSFGFVPLGGSLANMSFEAHVFREPRLKGLQNDIKNNVMAMRASAMNSQQGSNVRIEFPRGQDASNPDNQAQPDYGRSYNEVSENGFGERASGPSSVTSSPTPQPSWSQNTPAPVSPNTQGTRPPNPAPRYVDDSDPFDDDDGSPIPASVRRIEAQRTQSTQGGSAWDRIRQQSQSTNSSGQGGGWAQLRQDKAPNSQSRTEGFAYTKQDEDKEKRNYEKEQAQKEFDALLDSERRGGSSRR
ncbi:uncharacterized protein GGS22DRAFT_155045 [Annulohypoxylon maeteangense]|uniref:uncharacterized protein n=1 Tax=Annulohypoxylon maeteangense TaxID=1927788 RepID=UPI0020079956|nr:uncharacterized protein GGS22DRAFT_155045 [Annulohypoxylon maeteangense]KAI0888077.1 hypothetical protein GGS22DRAFT_155045 [Annulohypoxylon maeteangense]